MVFGYNNATKPCIEVKVGILTLTVGSNYGANCGVNEDAEVITTA
jgi:hypothetical protein